MKAIPIAPNPIRSGGLKSPYPISKTGKLNMKGEKEKI